MPRCATPTEGDDADIALARRRVQPRLRIRYVPEAKRTGCPKTGQRAPIGVLAGLSSPVARWAAQRFEGIAEIAPNGVGSALVVQPKVDSEVDVVGRSGDESAQKRWQHGCRGRDLAAAQFPFRHRRIDVEECRVRIFRVSAQWPVIVLNAAGVRECERLMIARSEEHERSPAARFDACEVLEQRLEGTNRR